jgi:drug/metabolite transporter (DMT)-like permease
MAQCGAIVSIFNLFQHKFLNGPTALNKNRDVVIAVAALVGVNALWGMSFPIMKALNEVISQVVLPGVDSKTWSISTQLSSSSLMIGFRFLLASLLLLTLLSRLAIKATRTEWTAGIWIGIVFCVGLILQVIGLATIPASRSGFLTSLTAVYTPILSSIIYRKSPSINVWVGAILALLGVLILSGVFHSPPSEQSGAPMPQERVPLNWGDVWTTLGSVFFSVQVLLVDGYGKKHRSAYFTPGMFLTTVVIALTTFFAIQIFVASPDRTLEGLAPNWIGLFYSPMFIGIVCFLALFCSLFSFLGMNTYQPFVSASQASVIYSTEPLFASLWAMVIPGWLATMIAMQYTNETITMELIVGGCFVFIANVVALWPQKKIVPTEYD